MTIQYHLAKAGVQVPSTSTIRRILHAQALIVPDPKKRPRSSYHRSLDRKTPNEWYHRTLKARPQAWKVTRDRDFRIRHDRTDAAGKVTLRHDGVLHHLGVRKVNARKKVVMIIDLEEVIVVEAETRAIGNKWCPGT
ncbi:hypothetical protein [Glutamicibacter sp. X7]